MGRTEQTRKYLEERRASWSADEARRRVLHYGAPDAEYDAIVDDGLGIVERGARDTLVVHGDDTIPWLQGLVTNDLHDLHDEGSGHRNAFVNTTGRFVGEARILHLPQLLMLDLEAGTLNGGLYSHLRQHIIMEDVTLEDRSEATARIGVYGSQTASLLEKLTSWEHELSSRPPFYGSWSRWKGGDLIAQRVVWSRQPGFEISCAVETVVPLLDAIESIHGSLPLVGHEAFEALRIEDGIPRFGVELHDRVIPLETDFDDAIAYDKGCYLGQEIIARLDTRGIPAKRLRRVVLDGNTTPEPKTPVYSADGDDKKIGHVESAAFSPRLDAPVALAFVKRNYNDIENTVRIDEIHGHLEPLMDLRDLT